MVIVLAVTAAVAIVVVGRVMYLMWYAREALHVSDAWRDEQIRGRRDDA